MVSPCLEGLILLALFPMAPSSVNRVSSPRAASGELLLAEVRPPRCSRAGRKLLEPEFDVVAVDAAPSTDARDKEAEVWVPENLAGDFRKFWPLPRMLTPRVG